MLKRLSSFSLRKSTLTSVGAAADVVRPEGYSRSMLLTSQLREYPSTAFALIDLLTGKKPYYLGEPLPIFSNRSLQ